MNWDYIAGLLDGEGSIKIAQRQDGFHLDITIAITDKWTLECCCGFTKMGNIHVAKKEALHRKTLFAWSITNRFDAMEFAKKVVHRTIIIKEVA